jgi:hypothetical protein
VGWGQSIQRLRITHQGISIRSFVDVKLKGSFWLTGGYERNQIAEADSEGVLTGGWGWQPSGLLGFSKVVSMRSKWAKKMKLKLFWDFLASSNRSPGSALIFRCGYSF